MPSKRPLTGADVDALFAGRFETEVIERCDNCNLPVENNDALTFGGDEPLQMPVNINGELARELIILRARHNRERIVLDYSCADALQTPVNGSRRITASSLDLHRLTMDGDVPRLFVE